MNENKRVDELYEKISRYGVMQTLCETFGAGCQIELGCTAKVCDTQLQDLDLSVRSYNALMRTGCKTVGQVIRAINDQSLVGVRNIGKKSVAEIRGFVLQYAYEQCSERRKKDFLHVLVQSNG